MKQVIISTEQQANRIKILPFNREYKVRRDLIDKMNTYGFVVPILLIKTDLITGKMEEYIVDGQHRFITARFLKIPVTAELLDIEFKAIEEIVAFVASLNATHKTWAAQDYVDAYSYLGYTEYITLNKITNSSPYSVSTTASLLYGYRSKSGVSDALKEGTFKCKQYDETLQTLNFAAKLSKIGKLTARMVIALHYVYHTANNFNEESFYSKYKEQYEYIKELNLDDYTDVFSSWV